MTDYLEPFTSDFDIRKPYAPSTFEFVVTIRTLLAVCVVGGCSSSAAPAEPAPPAPCVVDVTAPEDATPTYVPRVAPAYDFDQPRGPWPGAVLEGGMVDWVNEWPLTLCNGEPLPPGGSVLLDWPTINTQADVERLQKYRGILGLFIRPYEPLDVYLPNLIVTLHVGFEPFDATPVKVVLPNLQVTRQLNLMILQYTSQETTFTFDTLCAAKNVRIGAYYHEPAMPQLRAVEDLDYWSISTNSLSKLERVTSAMIMSVDLSGLSALEEVDQTLQLNISRSANAFVSPPRLRQVGGSLYLRIQHGGQAEESVTSFEGLEYVGGRVAIPSTHFLPADLFPVLRYVAERVGISAPTQASRTPDIACTLRRSMVGSPRIEVVDCTDVTGSCRPLSSDVTDDLWWPEESQ